MEIKSNLTKNIDLTNDNPQLDSKNPEKLEQNFQKEIDKKIKKEDDKKEQKQSKNNDNPENLKEELSKNKSKDLTDLKLFVLPYINKDILSINLKQSLNLDDKNNLLFKQNTLESNLQKHNQINTNKNELTTTYEKKLKNHNEDYLNVNPFEKFEKLYNSLKEISKEEKVKESKIIQQLVENINIKELENKKAVELNINKEIFGNLKIQILNEDNKVTILFKTDSKYSLDLIRNNVNQLKEMLKSRNLFVDSIKVEYSEELE